MIGFGLLKCQLSKDTKTLYMCKYISERNMGFRVQQILVSV